MESFSNERGSYGTESPEAGTSRQGADFVPVRSRGDCGPQGARKLLRGKKNTQKGNTELDILYKNTVM